MRRARVGSYLLAALAAVAAVGGIAAWMISAPRPAFSERDAAALDGGDAARGRLIFTAGECASCHASPGQSDRLRLGGGLELASPYGTFTAPNISSDPKDGIGSWQPVDIANAVMSGVSPDGSHYYPILPYASYVHMQVGDVRDLIAYLRTLPAVSGRQPQPDLAAPFRIRRFVGLWKFLFLSRGRIDPDPAREAAWNRGHYLVEAVAHCAECHSTRNIFGAIKSDTRFAGGLDPEGVGYVPNITSARLADWSERDISEMLKTGRTPNHGRVGSTMVDVVTNAGSLPQSDRDAIASYIKSLSSRPTPKP
jgi:mono/diheme cytochrome c family protein